MHDPGTFLATGAGAHKAASADEIKEIARRIEDGLSKGAVSIGAGFPYTPAATRDELLEVFRIAGRTHAPVHVHIRRGVSGLQEALKLAAQTKAPLHVVHINSAGTTATPEMLDMIAKARTQGLDVTTEAYPYTAGMTEIQSANLDEYENATEDRVAQLEWPRTGERLTRATFQKYRKMGGPVVIHTNTEDMVNVAVKSPLTMIASDAYWENGTGHPRYERDIFQGAGPLRSRAWIADADGRDPKDDADAGDAPAGSSARNEDEREAARGRGRRHRDIRCRADYRSLHLS